MRAKGLLDLADVTHACDAFKGRAATGKVLIRTGNGN